MRHAYKWYSSFGTAVSRTTTSMARSPMRCIHCSKNLVTPIILVEDREDQSSAEPRSVCESWGPVDDETVAVGEGTMEEGSSAPEALVLAEQTHVAQA